MSLCALEYTNAKVSCSNGDDVQVILNEETKTKEQVKLSVKSAKVPAYSSMNVNFVVQVAEIKVPMTINVETASGNTYEL